MYGPCYARLYRDFSTGKERPYAILQFTVSLSMLLHSPFWADANVLTQEVEHARNAAVQDKPGVYHCTSIAGRAIRTQPLTPHLHVFLSALRSGVLST